MLFLSKCFCFVLVTDLLPELFDAEHIIGNVVESDQPTGPDKRRIAIEILFDTLIRVITIDIEKVYLSPSKN
jgi:hypothetical protein